MCVGKVMEEVGFEIPIDGHVGSLSLGLMSKVGLVKIKALL